MGQETCSGGGPASVDWPIPRPPRKREEAVTDEGHSSEYGVAVVFVGVVVFVVGVVVIVVVVVVVAVVVVVGVVLVAVDVIGVVIIARVWCGIRLIRNAYYCAAHHLWRRFILHPPETSGVITCPLERAIMVMVMGRLFGYSYKALNRNGTENLNSPGLWPRAG